MRKIKEFISDMKKELDRIRWCKGKELAKNVIVTLMFILFFSLFFVIIEYVIALLRTIDFESIIERITDLF
jgi:preprotein translocase SecE subunit